MESSQVHYYVPEGLLFVEGIDAATFLQGQFSQDLRISEGEIAYGLWLSHKGKIMADSFVLRVTEEQFLAVSYFSESKVIRENLESRIIMDEVETRSCESGWTGVSVWGGAIDLALESVGIARPCENGFVSRNGVYAFWGRREAEPNLEILFSDGGEAQRFENFIAENEIQVLDSNEIGIRALRSGHFQIDRDILNTDLPQETGLADCAVSYGKGCFIGQEVMARLKSMGRPRRSLETVFVSRKPEEVGPWVLTTKGGLRAGELRRVVASSSGFVGSAMLKRSVDREMCFGIDGQEALIVSREREGARE